MARLRLRLCGVGSIVALTIASGCSDDVADASIKGRIAQDELLDGVTVTVAGELGVVELPFEMPMPAVDDAQLQGEMRRAVSLFIVSEISGAAADLAAGTPVTGSPAAPGEFSWTINEARDLAELSFFNESPGGLTLTVDRPYRAQLGVTRNGYVISLPTISFPITVTEG